MIQFLKKNWKFITIFILIGSIVFVWLRIRGGANPPPAPTTPLELIKTSPDSGTQEIPIPTLAIEFIFSKKLDESTLTIKSNPEIKLSHNFGENGKAVFVYPEKEWVYNVQYAITLNVQSEDGSSLENPITYVFTPKKVTRSELNEKGLR